MTTELLHETRQFLRSLEAAQTELSQLFDQKRAALTHARADELERLAGSESDLLKRLQSLHALRGRILQRASRAGLPHDTISHLVERIAGPELSQLRPKIQQARRQSERLRRESWIQWVIAQRAFHHYTGMLDLIANCGRQAATYTNGPAAPAVTGGALLDTSV
jgi:flagellar biosynthesis/type III secretory pathway chaperone